MKIWKIVVLSTNPASKFWKIQCFGSSGQFSIINQSDWAKIIQLSKETSNIERNICLYLKKCLKNEKVSDLPCYINKYTVRNSKRLLRQFWNRVECFSKHKSLEFAARWDVGILQIIAPLHNFSDTDAINDGEIENMHPMNERSFFKMVQIMASLLKERGKGSNPNATPNYWRRFCSSRSLCSKIPETTISMIL